jgi:hydrogenase maturation protein HypF
MSERPPIVEGAERAELIRVRGLVQGVGFRPTVWRLACEHALRGTVANDGEGLKIHVCGPLAAVQQFAARLTSSAPPLARIERLERTPAALLPGDFGFNIAASEPTGAHTDIVPDAAACPECVAETLDPAARRYRYPFTNCTHCGPRISIVGAIPYDRCATTMAPFALCAECSAEYADPSDRRFHAQPIACHACGPKARLVRADGAPPALDALTHLDAVDAVCSLLQEGSIVAVKGIGGFQLACDATDETAVARLRAGKRRERKPFALMARDLEVLRRHCAVSPEEAHVLQSAAAPIVLLGRAPASGAPRIAPSVAPGLERLGCMLPSTPLHHLMLRRLDRPIVLTSGNAGDEPQCIADDEAVERLGGMAEYFLLHDREIARRLDDSVVRIDDGAPRVIRRGRGYAPAPLPLPAGFERAPPVLALGGELKNAFCLLGRERAIVSQHIGDLGHARTLAEYRSCLADYLRLFEFEPEAVALDRHPEYRSTKLGREMAEADPRLAVVDVQHHHAHVAACLLENGVPLDHPPILGVALDGLGLGADDTWWGGEFLLADYRHAQRLGTFKPVALLGGERAMLEPWRNTYAHLMAEMGWPRFETSFAELELHRFLAGQPRAALDRMLASGLGSPLASSCGRLFDAVAAAVGVCREQACYEGQAAAELEALVDERALREETDEQAYPFSIQCLGGSGLPYVEPLPMWHSLLGDLAVATPAPIIAARFHRGLSIAIVRMIEQLARQPGRAEGIDTVALSGGVFQNRSLLGQVTRRLDARGLRVLTHRQVPCGDGGLALGQAAVAAARRLSPGGGDRRETCA